MKIDQGCSSLKAEENDSEYDFKYIQIQDLQNTLKWTIVKHQQNMQYNYGIKQRTSL